jgi:hypothetical protein
MNDPLWLEASRRLAERALISASTVEGRLDNIGRMLLARPWRPSEAKLLEKELEQFQATYQASDGAAARLVAVGESRPDPKLKPAELAPWMLVASTALNLDATLNK